MGDASQSAPLGYLFKLYVKRNCQRCEKSLRELKKVLGDDPDALNRIEVIELDQAPELIWQENILAIPTLVKIQPDPEQRLVGEFQSIDAWLVGFPRSDPA